MQPVMSPAARAAARFAAFTTINPADQPDTFDAADLFMFDPSGNWTSPLISTPNLAGAVRLVDGQLHLELVGVGYTYNFALGGFMQDWLTADRLAAALWRAADDVALATPNWLVDAVEGFGGVAADAVAIEVASTDSNAVMLRMQTEYSLTSPALFLDVPSARLLSRYLRAAADLARDGDAVDEAVAHARRAAADRAAAAPTAPFIQHFDPTC